MKIASALILSILCIQLFAYSNKDKIKIQTYSNVYKNIDTMKLKISVGSLVFTATLQNSATVSAFRARLPLTINMKELNGNEKQGELLRDLPTNSSNPGAIHTGDLMLWGSNTIVLFYKSFSTPYSYTRIGKIDDTSGLAAAVGDGNVTIIFEAK
jgi:hypothetical protein